MISKRNKFLIAGAAALICIVLLYKIYNRPVGEWDIYVNGLVYRKRTLKPFSGTVRAEAKKSWGMYSFCDGMPCGHFESRDFGDVTSEGRYIDQSKIQAAMRGMIGSDFFWISFWSEGPFDPQEPDFLEIEILDTSYLTGQVPGREQTDRIVNALVGHIPPKLHKYRFLLVNYESDLYINKRYWKEYRYAIKEGNVVFDMEDEKPTEL